MRAESTMSDQNKSMIETLDLHEDPFWQERVEKLYGWFHKIVKDFQGSMDMGGR